MNWFSKSSPRRIFIPKFVRTDQEGFEFFAHLMIETAEKGGYIFDFRHTRFFEANLCAVLCAIAQTNMAKGAFFSIERLDNKKVIYATFSNNGTLRFFDEKAYISVYKNSSVPIQVFDRENEHLVEEYVNSNVILERQVPEMTIGAKRKILRSIFEIYQNAVMHSSSDKVFLSGQFYTHKKRMALTIVDIGRTFKTNVISTDLNRINYSGKQSIEWAIQRGNTTKPEEETGGLGLDLIREFLRLNEGKIQIHSADGYWEERRGTTFAADCKTNFAGTVVNIEFNLRDKKSYFTPEEVDISSLL